MTPFEIARILAEPVLPHVYAKARHDLRRLTCRGSDVLDVGGRRSPYTVGLRAHVTIFDRPRESDVQRRLDLGVDDGVLQAVRRRRSNIDAIIFGDMTRCELPSASYDGVVSVEVIEHVREDDAFLDHVARVLKHDGWAYFTTPNGDAIENTNPDHVRHYRRDASTRCWHATSARSRSCTESRRLPVGTAACAASTCVSRSSWPGRCWRTCTITSRRGTSQIDRETRGTCSQRRGARCGTRSRRVRRPAICACGPRARARRPRSTSAGWNR